MLNDRLREARINAKFTQKEVAESIGIATTTYNGYERGKSDPDVGTLCKIMNLLGVDANFIYQDYIAQKNSPAPEGAEEKMSLEDSTALLVELGYIRPGEQLSDSDLAFLEHIVGLMAAWFDSKNP